MRTAQLATIDHLEASGLLNAVAAYSGEAEKSSQITGSLPAAYVVHVRTRTTGNRTEHTQHVLIAYRNKAVDRQDAVEGLGLVEAVTEYLKENHYWTDGTYTYQIKLQQELEARALRIARQYAVYVIRMPIEQWVS